MYFIRGHGPRFPYFKFAIAFRCRAGNPRLKCSNVSAHRRKEAVQGLQRRGLAGAVRADDAGDLSASRLQRDPVEHHGAVGQFRADIEDVIEALICPDDVLINIIALNQYYEKWR